MTVQLNRRVVIAAMTLVLAGTIGMGTAQAANITASEIGDLASIFGTQFDVTSFSFNSIGESADGFGAFIANSTATGMALVVLTEGQGGPNSDWFEFIYSGSVGSSVESITAHWRSDSDPGGLPALPSGVTPMFLAESGGVQDITALLAASATASGFAFPSNITIQVQSDAPEPAPEPASLMLLSVGLIALGGLCVVRKRKLNPLFSNR